MGFGRLGAEIMKENVSTTLEIPGHKIQAIILVCRVNQFSSIVSVLDENSTVYINQIVKIIHHCGEQWNGSVNKNEPDKYMLTWKMEEEEDMSQEADKSLIAAVKIICEIR